MRGWVGVIFTATEEKKKITIGRLPNPPLPLNDFHFQIKKKPKNLK
jgi:hypothetical protein